MEEQTYFPCEVWDGPRTSYVFKEGDNGLGYYKDTPPTMDPALAVWCESEHARKRRREEEKVGQTSSAEQ